MHLAIPLTSIQSGLALKVMFYNSKSIIPNPAYLVLTYPCNKIILLIRDEFDLSYLSLDNYLAQLKPSHYVDVIALELTLLTIIFLILQ